MKSQTKALLASVMVLALALSSVGGVTYSWFSDTEESDITVSTGTVQVETQLEKKSTTGYVSQTGMYINYSSPSTDNYRVNINNSGIPVIASVYVIIERYSAYDSTGYKGEVYAAYDESGAFSGYETYSDFFYGDQKRQNNIASYLKFGADPSSPTQKATWNGETVRIGSGISVKDKATGGSFGTFDIRYFEYQCYLGDIAIGNNQSSDYFYFSVLFKSGYDSDMMKKMYVRTIATQIEGACQSIKIDPITNSASASINTDLESIHDILPILFLGTDISITVDSISLFQSGIKTIDVSHIKNGTTLDVNISFKDSEGNLKEPVNGNIRIQSYNQNSCSLVVPSHSCTISLDIGGFSS